MSDPSLKNREDQVDDNEPEGGDEPALEITHDGDRTTVAPAGMSKREQRQKQWNERVGGVVKETTREMQDRIEHMNRTMEGINAAIARLGQQQPAPVAQPQAGGEPDIDPEFLKARRRQGEIMQLIHAAKTQPEVDRLEREFYAIDQQVLDARADKLASARLEKYQQEHPAPPDPVTAMIRSEFPDVITNELAGAYAWTLFRQAELQAKAQRRPFDPMTEHRKALQTSAEMHGIRRPAASKPDPAQAARFGGAPPTSSGGGGRVPKQLSRDQQEIARARYSDLPAHEADAKWANDMVKRDPHFFD